MLRSRKLHPKSLAAWRHLQARLGLPQQYGSACVKLPRFVGAHEDRRHDALFLSIEKRNLLFHILLPVGLHRDNFLIKLSLN
jgi:hypothetical protein